MKTGLSIFIYTIVFALLGTLAIAFSLHLIELIDVLSWLTSAYDNTRLRLITGLSGLIVILFSLITSQAIAGRLQREKTIAFSNPNGQVTITLSAVEDLIKRLAHQFSEIKDARADVKATKKGIDIRMRVVLRSETHIPDFTARLQDLISGKIQEVFGIDEPIHVKIHVAKIVSSEEKQKKKQDQTEEIAVPYPGIKI